MSLYLKVSISVCLGAFCKIRLFSGVGSRVSDLGLISGSFCSALHVSFGIVFSVSKWECDDDELCFFGNSVLFGCFPGCGEVL